MFRRSKQTVRSTRRKSRQKKRIFLLLCAVVVVIGVAFGGGYLYISVQPKFVSPLPSVLRSVFGQSETPDKKYVESLLKEQNIDFSDVLVGTDQEYHVKLDNNGEVFLTGKKDLKSQVASLQVILIRLTMERKQFKSLDMRFNKPVVVFK